MVNGHCGGGRGYVSIVVVHGGWRDGCDRRIIGLKAVMIVVVMVLLTMIVVFVVMAVLLIAEVAVAFRRGNKFVVLIIVMVGWLVVFVVGLRLCLVVVLVGRSCGWSSFIAGCRSWLVVVCG